MVECAEKDGNGWESRAQVQGLPLQEVLRLLDFVLLWIALKNQFSYTAWLQDLLSSSSSVSCLCLSPFSSIPKLYPCLMYSMRGPVKMEQIVLCIRCLIRAGVYVPQLSAVDNLQSLFISTASQELYKAGRKTVSISLPYPISSHLKWVTELQLESRPSHSRFRMPFAILPCSFQALCVNEWVVWVNKNSKLMI